LSSWLYPTKYIAPVKSKAEDQFFRVAGAVFPRGTLAVLIALLPGLAGAQTAVVSNVPDADAFVRSLAPTSNYGAAGALAVSGSAAVNGSGVQNGLFDSLMRFPMSNAVAAFDGALGAGNWTVTASRLIVNENASPDNAIFNRGVGAFEIYWMSSDNWIEGTGIPRAPTTDGVTWNDLPGLLNSNLDVSLGIFTNAGLDRQIAFTLGLADAFVASIQEGGEVGLHLTAASPSIGFTFNSRNFANTNAEPLLEITASAAPRIDGIGFSNGVVLVNFGTVSNWTYRLQGANELASGAGVWSDLLVVPSGSESGEVMYQDGVTNQRRFYRLSVSP
jgi:hypothetical protein